MSTGKSDGDYIILKLRRYPMYSTSELYELRMSLFDHGKPEECILFFLNFKMTLAATGMLETNAKVQYLCTLVRGEELRQFDLLYANVKNIDTSLTVEYLPKGLGWYFPPVN